MSEEKLKYYTPFAQRRREKLIDGVYRSKNGVLYRLRNMYFSPMICGETNKPYDAYQGEITQEGFEPVKRCLVDVSTFKTWERVF